MSQLDQHPHEVVEIGKDEEAKMLLLEWGILDLFARDPKVVGEYSF